MTRFRVLGLALALATSSAAQSLREIEVVIPSDEGRVLAGTLTLPATDRPSSAVVTITGSGAHFRDGNRSAADRYRPFREIAAALAASGIATLRLDDRGVGGSTGNNDLADGDDVARDTRIAIEWLRQHREIDPKRIGLVGHSFGGWVAPMVAAADSTIAAVVLMGASAGSFRETMRYQNAYDISRDPSIPAGRRAAALEAATRQQDRNVAGSTAGWRQWAQDRDPLPTARHIRAPVLILHGTTDRAVPPQDADRLAAAIKDGGNAAVTVMIFQNLNHHFQRDSIGARDGYGRLPTQELSREVLDAMARWLRATFDHERSKR